MDKLTGILDFESYKMPFFKNDFVFDFTTLDISLFQHWLPAETKPTNEGFVTGQTHSGHFIAIYTGQEAFRINATSSLHTFLYITSKGNATDMWCGQPFDGITFCGGCVDKIYHANAIASDNLFTEKEITLKLNDTKKQFCFEDSNQEKIKVIFSTNVSMSRSVEKGFSIKEDGHFLNISFENKRTLKDVPTIIQNVNRIISFLVFRQNLYFDKIYLTRKTDRADYETVAVVHLEQLNETQKSFNQTISIHNLGENCTDFLSLLWNNSLGTTSYVPEKDADAKMIRSIDIKEICSALEYEIDHTDGILSEEDLSLNALINEIKEVVKRHRESDSPLPPKTYDLIFGSISHWSQSLSNQIIALWQKHKEAIEVYSSKISYELTEEKIEAFVKYRNKTSHGNNLVLSQDIANTAVLLECLIYCNVLSRAGMTEENIIAICKNILFTS